MKRIATFIVSLLIISSLASANPLIGKWKVQIFGDTSDYHWEFTQHEAILDKSNNVRGKYTIDEETSTLVFPFNNEQVTLKYKIVDDEQIDLLFPAEYRDELCKQMSSSLAFGDGKENQNQLTRENNELITREVLNLFYNMTMVRLIKETD